MSAAGCTELLLNSRVCVPVRLSHRPGRRRRDRYGTETGRTTRRDRDGTETGQRRDGTETAAGGRGGRLIETTGGPEAAKSMRRFLENRPILRQTGCGGSGVAAAWTRTEVRETANLEWLGDSTAVFLIYPVAVSGWCMLCGAGAVLPSADV